MSGVATAGVFEAILTEEDAIISDELNHASIIDGTCGVCAQSCAGSGGL